MAKFRCRLFVKWAVVVFIALCVYLYVFPDDSLYFSTKVFIGFSLPVSLLALWYVLSMGIDISDSGMRYRFLIRDCFIRWSDITRIQSAGKLSPETLETVLNVSTSKQPRSVKIPVMWFHISLLREILKHIPQNVPVDLSEVLERQLAGKSIIFYRS